MRGDSRARGGRMYLDPANVGGEPEPLLDCLAPHESRNREQQRDPEPVPNIWTLSPACRSCPPPSTGAGEPVDSGCPGTSAALRSGRGDGSRSRSWCSCAEEVGYIAFLWESASRLETLWRKGCVDDNDQVTSLQINSRPIPSASLVLAIDSTGFLTMPVSARIASIVSGMTMA